MHVLVLALLAFTPADVPEATKEPGPFAAPALEPGRDASFRLIVTAGLDGLKGGGEAFFGADLFQGGADAPIAFDTVDHSAFRLGDCLYFADGALTAADVVSAAGAPVEARDAGHALFGPSSIALTRSADPGTDDVLERALAAVRRPVAIERRTLGGVTVIAVDASPASPAGWPAVVADLDDVAVAHGSVAADGGQRAIVVFERRKSASARTFGIVDALLQQTGMPPTGFVDVGGALSSARDTSVVTARAVRQLLLARKPLALAMGRAELGAVVADPALLDGAPYVVAADWGAASTRPEVVREADLAEHRLAFVALGELGTRARALLPSGARALSSAETAAVAGAVSAEGNASFVVGIGVSAEGVEDALSSGNFDAVMSLTGGRVAALAAVDDIDLRENHRQNLHAGPTLIRASAADVGEVFVWLDPTGRVERIRTVRHAVIDDGAEADDARAALDEQVRRTTNTRVMRSGAALAQVGLPPRSDVGDGQGRSGPGPAARAWTGADLDWLRGALLRDALGAELSLLPHGPRPVSVHGAVPPELALAWLSQRAAVSTTRIRGGDLAKVFDAIKKGSLDVVVTGADAPAGTVAQRPLNLLEWYLVALPREVAASLDRLGVAHDDSASAAASVDDVVARALGEGLDAERCARLMRGHAGAAVHAFFVDVADVAGSVTAQTAVGEAALVPVHDARLSAPDALAFAVDGVVRLGYDGPQTFVTLIGTNRYARTTLDDGDTVIEKELRDQALLEAELGLQLARLLQTSPTLTPLPLLRLAYESEWTPAEIVGDDGSVVVLPRSSKVRGFVGAVITPLPILDRVRLGGVIQNDLVAVKKGIDVGAEAAIEGNWKVWGTRLHLDSFARAFLPDPVRDGDDELGLVSQTVGRVDIALFGDVRLSLFADAYVASGKLESTRGPAWSVITGASLGSATRIKFLPFGS